MKNIWKQFVDYCKQTGKVFIKNIKEFAKETFEILKNGCIVFVQAIFKWIWELLKGISNLLIMFIKTIYNLLVNAIKSTLSFIYEKTITWIKKW